MRFLASLLAVGLLSAGLTPPPSHAETFLITKEEDDDGPCTPADCALREAVLAANSTSAADTILLPAGIYKLTLSGFDLTARRGDLDISRDLELRGIDEGKAIIMSDGTDRVFEIMNSTVEFSNVEITGGVAGLGAGAWILTSNVTFVDSVISDNHAIFSDGGGIALERGRVTLIRSTVTGNSAFRGGGGIQRNLVASAVPNSLEVVNSTVSGNSAFEGGGIYNRGRGTMTLIHSTVANNQATFRGEALFFDNAPNNVIGNSIIEGRCGASFGITPPTSLGGNVESPGSTCFLLDPTDRMGIPDVLLGPLAMNGGPTPTHALLPGSPAIDAGVDAACEPTDQRGAPRPEDGNGDGIPRCDAGAFEAAAVIAIPALSPSGLAALIVLLTLWALRQLRHPRV